MGLIRLCFGFFFVPFSSVFSLQHSYSSTLYGLGSLEEAVLALNKVTSHCSENISSLFKTTVAKVEMLQRTGTFAGRL